MTDGAGMNGPYKQTLGGQLSGTSWDLSDRNAAEIVSTWLRSDEVAAEIQRIVRQECECGCHARTAAHDVHAVWFVLDALSGLVSEEVERAHQDDWRPEEDGE